MERVEVDGITLEYEVSGSGEPVVCIHGAFIADTFRPLAGELSLVGRYQLITYHRRGYVGSSRTSGPVSVTQQAADCRALLQHLGVARAHVVGHSFGGCIALQLALEAPEVVHTLALLEPGLMVGASAQSYRDALLQNLRRYREVGAGVVVDEFLQARWPGYRVPLAQVLPGAFEQAVANAATWFESDLPAGLDWSFSETEARRITQPILSVLGEQSDALWSRFGETHRLLLTWLPHAEGFVLPGATHFLQLQNPRGMAGGLTAFFARHPCPVGGRARTATGVASAGNTPAGWAPAGILRRASEAETANLGPNHASFPLRGEETGGTYSLTDFVMAPPPAPGPPPHIHEDADEAVYVLEGTLEMGVGEQRLVGSPGSVMLVPRGTLHSLANPGPGPARMLIILSPPGYEGFWREMAELRAKLGGPPDAETVLALQRKYHLTTGGRARRFD